MTYIKQNIRHLRIINGFSQEKMADLLNVSRDNIASYERGTEPKIEFVTNLVNFFHIDINDFISTDLSAYSNREIIVPFIQENINPKRDNIFTRTQDGIKIITPAQIDSLQDDSPPMFNEPDTPYHSIRNIPMFSSVGTAGEVEVYNDIAADQPAFYVSIPQFADCKFGKLIYGHSMYPTICSGSYVFCKPVTNKARYIPGEIYYVEYDNFGVCKRLQKGPNKDEVLLVSDNVEVRPDGTRRYESYVLKIDDIRELFLVKGFLNQNHN